MSVQPVLILVRRFHVVAVPSNLSDEPVQTFQAFTRRYSTHGRLAQNHWSGGGRYGIYWNLLGAGL